MKRQIKISLMITGLLVPPLERLGAPGIEPNDTIALTKSAEELWQLINGVSKKLEKDLQYSEWKAIGHITFGTQQQIRKLRYFLLKGDMEESASIIRQLYRKISAMVPL